MDQADALDAFAPLAHEARLAVFRLLVEAGRTPVPALQIARRLGAKPSTLSGHLAILRRAGLVTAARHQREIRYGANRGVVTALVTFLLSDCCGGDVAACADLLPSACLVSSPGRGG